MGLSMVGFGGPHSCSRKGLSLPLLLTHSIRGVFKGSLRSVFPGTLRFISHGQREKGNTKGPLLSLSSPCHVWRGSSFHLPRLHRRRES